MVLITIILNLMLGVQRGMSSKKLDRCLKMVSIALVVIIILELFPMRITLPVGAATEGHPEFTFTVTDGSTPISGATVNVYRVGNSNPVFTDYTDDSGVVEITRSDLQDDYLEYSYEYEVSKNGYISAPKTNFTISTGSAIEISSGSSIDVTSHNAIILSGNVNVILIPIPQTTVSGNITDGTNGISGATVSLTGYSDYSTVSAADGSFSISHVYDTGVYSMKIEHTDYKTIEVNANLHDPNNVTMELKSEQSQLLFEKPLPAPIDFGALDFTNVASGGDGEGSISYEVISGFDVADVDSNGKIKTKKAGNITVRATKAGDNEYKPATAEYTLTINPINQASLYFDTPDPIKYESNLTFTNTAKGGSGDGAISYSIVEGDAASIDDPTKGILNIKKAGTVTVKAVKAAEAGYSQATATYTLTINKGDLRLGFENPTPADIKINGQKFKNVVTDKSGSVTYEIVEGASFPIEGGYSRDRATIDSSTGTLTFYYHGTVTVRATRAADDCYNKATAEYKINIIESNSANDLKFENPSPSITITYRDTFQNKASRGNETVAYSVSDLVSDPNTNNLTTSNPITNKVATIDSITGKLNILKAGIVQVTAYTVNNPSEKISYTLIINKAQQTNFKFEIVPPKNLTFGDNGNAFTIVASGGESTSNSISYSITKGTNVAQINNTTGELTISQAGEVEVTATKAGDDRYESATTSYTLAISKAEQTGFDFSVQSPNSVTYGDNGNIFTNIASGGESTSNSISYRITKGINVAKIDTMTGVLTILEAGEVEVTATKVGDNCYLNAETSYSLTINKADQTGFKFANPGPVEHVYGSEMSPNLASGGQSIDLTTGNGAEISYKISDSEPENIASINPNTGELSFNNDKVGTITIEATRKGDNCYKEITASYTLNVIYEPFPSALYDISDKDNLNDNGWFNKPIKITPGFPEFFKISQYYELNGEEVDKYWSDKLEVNVDRDGKEPFVIYLRNNINNGITNAIRIPNLKIDQTKPTNLSVTYSAPVKILDTFLETIFFGFYQASATVTIKAEDITSGVESFVYRYTVDSDASTVNVGTTEDQIVPADKITYTDGGKTATATFSIPAQFRGKVSFSAIDRASNITDYYNNNDKSIVVDTIAPGVTVGYDDGTVNAQNGNFYSGNRTAIIKIEEANFFNSDVKIDVKRRLNGEAEYSSMIVNAKFEKSKEENEKDVYIASILFDEDADYTFDIEYTDQSGNVYDSYQKDEFTIDKTLPVIQVTYDNNLAQNNKYYKANRTAEIKIVDHNFSPELVSAIVTAKDMNNEEITTDDYAELLKDPTKWSSEGDIHTAKITFLEDGFYTFDIDCKDKAANAPVSDYPMDDFVIDKAAPTESSIKYSAPVLDTILENISFGFYQARMTVTISAEDATSGVNQFVYSYDVEEGESSINVGVSNQIVTAGAISVDGKVAEVRFSIEPQFRGRVSFDAIDKSGNVTKLVDDKVIVVDDVAPGVKVTYDNQNAVNKEYYNANRIAKIEVTEANFDEDDVNITVGKRTTESTVTRVKPIFSKDKDVYTAMVEFSDDADYTFDIKYTDKSGNVFDSYKMDKFTVDKIKPIIEVSYDNNNLINGKYYNAKRKATIKVTEHNFNAADFCTTITAKNFANNEIPVVDYATYLKNPANWTTDGDLNTASIEFSEDAQYTFDVSYTDLAGNEAEDFEENVFVVDSTIPENLSVKYSTPFLDTMIENVSFGFYESPVNVTITADDVSAGIDYFIYSYEVEKGASSTNTGVTDKKVTSDQIIYSNNGKTATISFFIEPQYRGTVAFKAVDKAGNIAMLADNKVIVVDNVAPGVAVQYDNQSAQNVSYYKANRTAVIVINEANFFDSDVRIAVGKQLDSQGSFIDTIVKPVFIKSGDTYTAKVLFDENADYTFDISHVDKSGNIFNSYKKDMFTIDKIAPSIKVSYDNNSASNGKMFKDKRTANICITEHNFKAEDIIVKFSAQNADGSNVVTYDYVSKLKKPQTWNRSGDTYTAVVEFTEDANYKFDIGYVDLAGNINSAIDYSKSVAPNEFTIDKGLPSGSIHIGKLNETTSEKVWNTFLETISFGLWSNKEVTVKLSSSDTLSGIEQVKYFRTDTPMTLSEVKAKSDGWTSISGGDTSFKVPPDEQFIVYSNIVDKAGNSVYISSDGIIADSTGPKVETLSPKITVTTREQPKNMIFNKDVSVDIAVEDPASKNSVYSGLKSVTYQVINMGSVTQEDKLYTFNKVAPVKSDLMQRWKGSIVVDSKKNNSNDVMVKITVEDNAKNTVTKTLPIKIDITEPTIDIKYDNNVQDSGFDGYFKENRTATVVVTERNFNKEDVKLDITNTDGERAVVSDWIKVSGTGNGDNTTHTAKIGFVDDGDYTFDISYTDLANNKNTNVNYGNSIAPKAFTIDKTVPVIAVNYNTNNAKNENYFNSRRVATISITEHNFDASRIKISMTSTDGGAPSTTPGVSQWTDNGDVHSATISFEKDALYTFDIDYTDKAGNIAADFKQQSFYIDNTVPKISITGVADKSAYKGDVIPIITCSDSNFDVKSVNISLVGANRKSVKLDGTTANTNNGMVFTFRNFKKVKEVDDLYTLSVNVMDKAGNSFVQSVSFSVNRFGSTYTVADTTEKILGKFISSEEDIVLTETNVDALHEIKITMFKDNMTKVMSPNKDYTIKEVGGKNMWHQYIYTIRKDNFTEDGVYRLTVYSVDKANNKSENTMDTKLTEISFGVDKTEPNIIVADLEEGETYPLNSKPVTMSINDNLKLESVKVVLNGKEIKKWSSKDIEKRVKNKNDFGFEVAGDSIQAHDVKISSVDAAGNEKIVDIKNFYVTTNLLVRFLNNKPVFFGVTGGMTVITVPFAAYSVFRRRKIKIK